jgi:dTDP-4-dehydrorhamnose 3,5-epimerase
MPVGATARELLPSSLACAKGVSQGPIGRPDRRGPIFHHVATPATTMNTIPTELTEIVIVEPKVFGDERGYFFETWHSDRYRAAGLPSAFVQDNLSYSLRGVLRGLHFQNPYAQGKLLSVLLGEVFDVAVDIRRGSPTFGRWVGVTLSAENRRQLYVPEGFAHGFCVLSDAALLQYKCTELYQPSAENSLRWDDPQFGIAWPVEQPILSEKDRRAPLLGETDPEKLPVYREARGCAARIKPNRGEGDHGAAPEAPMALR